MPAPAGAGCVLFPLFHGIWLDQTGWPLLAAAVRHPAFVGLVMVVVAGLLVSIRIG